MFFEGIMKNNLPKILSNDLDQAPKIGSAYEQRLSDMTSEIKEAFTEGEYRHYESRIE